MIMKAWLLDATTGLSALRLAEIPAPIPQPGGVVLEILWAALNPADRYLAEAQYPARPQLPHILGRDGLGRVVALGQGAQGVALGDLRILLRSEAGVSQPGTLAQRVQVPADALTGIPHGWSPEQAAGAPLVYLTAYQALTQWGTLPPSLVLITGASGGVGIASLQLALAMGHRVAALSRDALKREKLWKLGATWVGDPADPLWRKDLRKAFDSQRVELAIDSVGGRLLPEVLETLGEFGKVSLVGRLAGPVPEFNTASLFFRRLRLGGVALTTWSREELNQAWREVLGLLGQRKPVVDSIFPMEQLPAAFERLAQGPMGKVLVRIAAEA